MNTPTGNGGDSNYNLRSKRMNLGPTGGAGFGGPNNLPGSFFGNLQENPS